MKFGSRRFWIVVTVACIPSAIALFVFRRMAREEENYALIEDGLYVGGWGTEPPRGTKAVLNVCETKDAYSSECYVWEAIADSAPAPTTEWLRRMVLFIDKQRRAGSTTFVHCRNGVSRSGMVIVAYEMFKHGWSRDEALVFVRSKRPQIHPHPAFMERLLEFEGELKAVSDEPSTDVPKPE